MRFLEAAPCHSSFGASCGYSRGFLVLTSHLPGQCQGREAGVLPPGRQGCCRELEEGYAGRRGLYLGCDMLGDLFG